MPTTTHSHVIDFNEAKEMGLNVIQWRKDPLYSSNLTHYKQFVRIKLKEESISHIIESFLPSKLEKNEETDKEPHTSTKSITEWHKTATRVKQRKK